MKTRPHMPVGVKLKAALLALGFTWEEVQAGGKAIHWDHFPALGLRAQVKRKNRIVYTPDANDPRCIRPIRVAAHHRKTNGTAATTAGSDKHAIAKAKRLSDQQEEFRRTVLKKAGQKPGRRPQRWPTRKMGSRGFRHV